MDVQFPLLSFSKVEGKSLANCLVDGDFVCFQRDACLQPKDAALKKKGEIKDEAQHEDGGATSVQRFANSDKRISTFLKLNWNNL